LCPAHEAWNTTICENGDDAEVTDADVAADVRYE